MVAEEKVLLIGNEDQSLFQTQLVSNVMDQRLRLNGNKN